MSLLTHLRAYLARRRWQAELLARFPTAADYEVEMFKLWAKAYADGKLDAEHPADRLRKGLAKQFPVK